MPQFNSASYGDLTAMLREAYALVRDDTEGAVGDKMKRATIGDILQHTLGYYGDSVEVTTGMSGSAGLTDADVAIQFFSTSGSAGYNVEFPSAGDENHPFVIINSSGSAGGTLTANDTETTEIAPGEAKLFFPGVSYYPLTGSKRFIVDDAWTSKGDLAVGTGASEADILGVGADGYNLVASSAETTGIKWIAPVVGIDIILGNGLAEIATGVDCWVRMPYDCTITGVMMLANESGSIVMDIWKNTYANYPPTDVDSITSSAPPTISSATKSTDTTLTDWTTDISEGDILMFNVDSVTDIKRLTLTLMLKKTTVG